MKSKLHHKIKCHKINEDIDSRYPMFRIKGTLHRTLKKTYQRIPDIKKFQKNQINCKNRNKNASVSNILFSNLQQKKSVNECFTFSK